jgi:choline-glycine betaine transporter
MSEQRLTTIAEIALVASLGVSLILMFLMVTLLFRKTEEVERRIATRGKQLDSIRIIWGNGPIGRWMRISHVYVFFLFRHLPRIGPRIEARMGDENEALPLSLKLWVIVPFSVYAVSVVLFFFTGWYLEAYD